MPLQLIIWADGMKSRGMEKWWPVADGELKRAMVLTAGVDSRADWQRAGRCKKKKQNPAFGFCFSSMVGYASAA